MALTGFSEREAVFASFDGNIECAVSEVYGVGGRNGERLVVCINEGDNDGVLTKFCHQGGKIRILEYGKFRGVVQILCGDGLSVDEELPFNHASVFEIEVFDVKIHVDGIALFDNLSFCRSVDGDGGEKVNDVVGITGKDTFERSVVESEAGHIGSGNGCSNTCEVAKDIGAAEGVTVLVDFLETGSVAESGFTVIVAQESAIRMGYKCIG